MKKLLFLTVVIAILAMSSGIAYASLNWDGDPIFSVEGTTVSVLIEAEEEVDPSKVRVTVRVPKGVEVDDIDAGGFDLEIKKKGKAKDDKIPVKVTVKVPKAKPKFDVRVTVQVPDYGISESRDGTTGRKIKMKVEIPIGD